MTTPEAIDLAALRVLAEKATPGPWSYGRWTSRPDLDWQVFCDADCVTPCPSVTIEADATFIAAANPRTVLALLAELEASRRCMPVLRSAHAFGDNLAFINAAAAYDRAIAGQQPKEGTT